MSDQQHELTYANATHVLECTHSLGRNEMTYYMRCHVLKRMPDGKRLNVLVFGQRYWKDKHHISRVRYVKSWRVSPIASASADSKERG